jgi:hypothetical protein
MDYTSGIQLTKFVLYFVLPFLVIEVAGWAVCLGFQSLYAPVIKPRKLLACHYLGPDLVQCGMVSSSWVGAIVYRQVYHLYERPSSNIHPASSTSYCSCSSFELTTVWAQWPNPRPSTQACHRQTMRTCLCRKIMMPRHLMKRGSRAISLASRPRRSLRLRKCHG